MCHRRRRLPAELCAELVGFIPLFSAPFRRPKFGAVGDCLARDGAIEPVAARFETFRRQRIAKLMAWVCQKRGAISGAEIVEKTVPELLRTIRHSALICQGFPAKIDCMQIHLMDEEYSVRDLVKAIVSSFETPDLNPCTVHTKIRIFHHRHLVRSGASPPYFSNTGYGRCSGYYSWGANIMCGWAPAARGGLLTEIREAVPLREVLPPPH